jgi:hypothetical protein
MLSNPNTVKAANTVTPIRTVRLARSGLRTIQRNERLRRPSGRATVGLPSR